MAGRDLEEYEVFDRHEELIPLFEESKEADLALQFFLVCSILCLRVSVLDGFGVFWAGLHVGCLSALYCR